MTTSKPHKTAVLSALLAYKESYGGRVPNFVVDQMAQKACVGPRQLRRWVNEVEQAKSDDATVDDTTAQPKSARPVKGSPFTITEEHLVTVRSTLNIKAAHALLFPEAKRGQTGWVSYPTFARAFKNLPPSLRDGVLGGWDAMAKAQVYLSMAAPHRNHSWHLDHTEADVWVSIRGGSIIRPHVSIVRDNATSMRLAAIAYLGRPNEDSICDLLATAALPREYKTSNGVVAVGGLPVQLVLDNGLEHFSEAVTRGALMLGVAINPTKAFYKHLNGPAESTFNGLNNQLFKALPGYKKGGNGDDGQPLIAARYADQVDPDSVLTMESFQKHLDKWLVNMNTTQKVHRLGNQTALTAWNDDPTVIRDAPEETVRAMMLRSKTQRVVNAEGIRFRGVDYTAPELGYYRERGLKLRIGYLMRETRFIEVFDGETHVCRAIDRTLLTEHQRRAILLGRERDLDLLKRVNAAANQERAHRAATDDTDAYDEEELDPTMTAAVDEAVDNVTNITRAPRKDSAHVDADTAPNPTTEIDMTPEFKRVDPTTPKRTRRQQAPSRSAAQQKRQEAKTDQVRERITKRPGANFGEDE
ncbi:Mu transposase C-terminal domain-containing protein [Microbacterium sp.]|uniref:Mu transposase C-terminal domain-containing protein n=1 Tax=Microbacterium sp. TaxID=51671 RepID=UPI0027341156|nr:Mu transposase C-terminal domain-containing protein [Microbacterium sp.]MDP3950816.1 Mu transposase C-terminal domain-containing protein [Microbacterium sp.]